MEREELTDTRSKMTFAQRLESLCEYYMMLGVPYEEFWFGDYCKLKFYEQLYYDKQKVRDAERWSLGMYIYNAFTAVIRREFGGDRNASYPKEPFSMAEKPKERTVEELQADIYAQLKATIKE